MKTIEQKISSPARECSTAALESAATVAPAPFAAFPGYDNVNIHQEPVAGVFFNKKRVGIIVAIVLIILFSGVMFAMTVNQTKSGVGSLQQTASTGDIPLGVAAPPLSYADLQNKPKPNHQPFTTQTPLPRQNPPVPYRTAVHPQQNALLLEAQATQKEADTALKSPLRFSGMATDNANTGFTPTATVTEKATDAQGYLHTSTGSGVTTDSQLAEQPDQNNQAEKTGFLSQNHSTSFYAKGGLQPALSSYEIKAGTIIPGVMISGLDSDLPGEIIAQVRENVYDSLTGQYLLVPQGAKIIGVYDSKVTYGQNRALVVWTRLILPNGDSLDLESLQGSDQSGYTGFEQHTDNHAGRVITAVLVTGLLDAAGAWAGSQTNSSGTTINVGGTAAAGATQAATTVGSQMVNKSLNLQPTIKIDPGYRFNIMVTKDFIMSPYQG